MRIGYFQASYRLIPFPVVHLTMAFALLSQLTMAFALLSQLTMAFALLNQLTAFILLNDLHSTFTNASSDLPNVGGLSTGPLFEGDIKLCGTDAPKLLNAPGSRNKRKITYLRDKLWTLPVPYMFDTTDQYQLNDSERGQVQAAIRHIEDLTCITFQEVNASHPARPILTFKKDAGCWSYVGKERAFQFQEVSTGEGCFQFGTLLHELGHALGFWHEHARPDRDAFIRVHPEFVRTGEEFNFIVESWGELDNMGVPYDVGSIMHYGSTYFSRNGHNLTIETVDSRLQRVLGQRLDFSFYDIKLANFAYCSGNSLAGKFGVKGESMNCSWYKNSRGVINDMCGCAQGSRTRRVPLPRTVQPIAGAISDQWDLMSEICVKSPVQGMCLHDGYPDPKNCNRCRCPTGLSGIFCQTANSYQGHAVCGGKIFIGQGQRYSISSPSSPWVYPANVVCSWLIQTQQGMQVILSVGKTGFMMHPDCGPFPSEVCTDYLEVKYNVSFGYTGARYCCGHPPENPIRSSSNAMLVIFHTRQSGTGGFSADIVAEPCGGCFPGNTSQPPCRKIVTSQCLKEWTSTDYKACPVFFRGTSYDCNKWVTTAKSRLGVCTAEVDTCCNGYQVYDGMCREANGTSRRPQSGPAKETSSTNTASTYLAQDADVGWSTWLPWQACSKSCGGCGVQVRTRLCDNPAHCSDKSVEEESRSCNTLPCSHIMMYLCTKSRVRQYFCGLISRCYHEVTEYSHCYTNCCPHYVLKAGICVPNKP